MWFWLWVAEACSTVQRPLQLVPNMTATHGSLISYQVKAQAALPIVDIMTMAATGSEYDAGGWSAAQIPTTRLVIWTSICGPFALSSTHIHVLRAPRQTIAGVADAINHIMEQYFASPANDLSDGFCEAGFKTLMKNVHLVLKNPEDYEARANIFLACTYSLQRHLFARHCPFWLAHARHRHAPFCILRHHAWSGTCYHHRDGCDTFEQKRLYRVLWNLVWTCWASTPHCRIWTSPTRASTWCMNSSRASALMHPAKWAFLMEAESVRWRIVWLPPNLWPMLGAPAHRGWYRRHHAGLTLMEVKIKPVSKFIHHE